MLARWQNLLTNKIYVSELFHSCRLRTSDIWGFPLATDFAEIRTIEPFSHNESWPYSGSRTHTYLAEKLSTRRFEVGECYSTQSFLVPEDVD